MAKKRVKDCPHCGLDGGKAPYNEEHDAYFCPKCLIWLSKSCKDPDCDFCSSRPDKPRYTLAELLAQCDFDMPLSQEDKDWLNAKPVGKEIL